MSLFRVESGSLRGDSQEIATRGKCVTPVEVSAPWKDWTNGVAAVTLKMRVENAEAGAVVTVRVGDVLDARRKAMIVDLRVPGRGEYSVTLDIPDQIYLPPNAKWKPLPRLDGLLRSKSRETSDSSDISRRALAQCHLLCGQSGGFCFFFLRSDFWNLVVFGRRG